MSCTAQRGLNPVPDDRIIIKEVGAGATIGATAGAGAAATFPRAPEKKKRARAPDFRAGGSDAEGPAEAKDKTKPKKQAVSAPPAVLRPSRCAPQPLECAPF